MQDEVVYSEVVFIRTEDAQRKKSNAEVSAVDAVTYSEVKIPKTDDREPQCKPTKAESHTEACVHCAVPAFVALCLILLGAVAVLGVLYFFHDLKLKEWSELQDLRSENKTEHGPLPGISADSQSNCYQACPKEWEFHGGKCYLFAEDLLNWTLSRDRCISVGGHLAIIKSNEEQEFVRRSVESKMKNDSDRFWIGLTDEQVGTQWLWVDNTPLDEMIRYWTRSEPDNFTIKNPTGENCASMGRGFLIGSLNWYNEVCATLYKRICETISPNQG